MFEIENISKSFTSKSGTTIALKNVSFRLDEAKFSCISGPTGCGKTTLLKIISKLIHPDSGEVKSNKKDPAIGFVFQEKALFPWRTVRQNIEFGLEIKRSEKIKKKEKSKEWLEQFNLTKFENKYLHELSAGMQQKVAIAAALAPNPDILLLDEPFSSLDSQTRYMLQNDIIDLYKSTKKTILFVTHDIDEAIVLSDKIFVMSKRPGNIKKEIEIDLDRPRIKDSKEFKRIRDEIKTILENEVSKELDL